MSQSWNLNEAIIGRDGGIFINNFAQNDGYDVHPERALPPEVPRRQSISGRRERRIIDG